MFSMSFFSRFHFVTFLCGLLTFCFIYSFNDLSLSLFFICNFKRYAIAVVRATTILEKLFMCYFHVLVVIFDPYYRVKYYFVHLLSQMKNFALNFLFRYRNFVCPRTV
jgi:hypothetical protein